MRAIGCALLFLTAFLPVHATVEGDYAQADNRLEDAESLERAGNKKDALAAYNDCYGQLQRIRSANPDWQRVLIADQIHECFEKVDELERQVNPQPVLPADLAHRQVGAHPVLPVSFTSSWRSSAVAPTHIYPWKSRIVTTVFWIGEGSTANGWNPSWVTDNGGPDDQYGMNGYASERHASTLNPFYAALPFNDLTHPELTYRWLPRGWIKPLRDKNGVSVCKDRWIEIKNASGRTCFAQWEDVGPIASDDAAYVFGPYRPTASRGLAVSPAVAKYLGIDSLAIASWRFVDDDDVEPGMWLRYDEEAILFSALLQQKDALKAGSPSR
jgi:hypothetical protein